MTDLINDSSKSGDSNHTAHATMAELLAIRDAEPLSVARHISQCSFCQARLEEVYAMGRDLQQSMLFEAELPVPSAAWTAIEQRLKAEGVVTAEPGQHGLLSSELLHTQHAKPSIWSSINTAIYSLAAAVMFTGLVSLYTFQGQQQTRIETQALQASIQSLMDNSRGLESVLQQVASQNSTLASVDLATAERLQWRLMMVDQKIHESESSDNVSYEQIKGLWADRIDALTALNRLYYTNQAAPETADLRF